MHSFISDHVSDSHSADQSSSCKAAHAHNDSPPGRVVLLSGYDSFLDMRSVQPPAGCVLCCSWFPHQEVT